MTRVGIQDKPCRQRLDLAGGGGPNAVMPEDNQELPREAAEFLAAFPATRAIDAIYPDLCGILRGKRYPISLLGKLMADGLATPGSVFLLDAIGENHDPEGRGFSDGDPDSLGKVIPGSLKPMPWAQEPTGQVMMTFSEADGSPYPFEPRNVLAAVAARLAALGLTPVVAFELEFYLIDRQRLADGSPQPPLSPRSGKRMSGAQVYGMHEVEDFSKVIGEITRCCEAQGIATGAITKEYAAGQFEINLNHLDDPLVAADHCIMFKRVVKGVAEQFDFEATFMAKPYADAVGSGLHLHCSLLNDGGENVFAEAPEAAAGSVSDTLKHAIGGILGLMPAAMGILAPSVNSFRRYRPNIFVPTQRSWDLENRSVALRIPSGPRSARRIEHRIAGADANPYLTLATLLAGVHHGLTNKIDPGPPTTGNAGERYDPDLPFRPRRALQMMLESDQLKSYLGTDYVKTYVACKLAELDKFEAIVSPAEYEWYL